MISIIQRDGLFLIFDTVRGTYRWASASVSDARATIPRAQAAQGSDWLDNDTLTRALKARETKVKDLQI